MVANAFYSPRAHGILFGYFRAEETNQGRNLPGQVVYTCLSHDIIVHEMTHAIVDGIRGQESCGLIFAFRSARSNECCLAASVVRAFKGTSRRR